jgi:hypothetical protein
MRKPISLEVYAPGAEEPTFQHYIIRPLKLKQVKELAKTANGIVSELSANGTIKGLADQLLSEEAQDVVIDQQLVMSLIGSFETFAVKMPEEATNVLSVLSGVEVEVLDEQELEKVLEVYEAVLEVNDIEKLVERLKKSFNLTMGRFKLPNFQPKLKQPTA